MVEQQEAEILRCRAHFDASQSVKENKNNLSADIKDILAEEGIKYLCDWVCDDQPFPNLDSAEYL